MIVTTPCGVIAEIPDSDYENLVAHNELDHALSIIEQHYDECGSFGTMTRPLSQEEWEDYSDEPMDDYSEVEISWSFKLAEETEEDDFYDDGEDCEE